MLLLLLPLVLPLVLLLLLLQRRRCCCYAVSALVASPSDAGRVCPAGGRCCVWLFRDLGRQLAGLSGLWAAHKQCRLAVCQAGCLAARTGAAGVVCSPGLLQSGPPADRPHANAIV